MKKFLAIPLLSLLITSFHVLAQMPTTGLPKGKLFIIGGGARPAALMQTMVATAELKASDYIVVLPMSSAEPDTSFYYIRRDLEQQCTNPVIQLNFTSEDVQNKRWIDSLQKARLIFITGGDQNRFMKIVLHTPVHAALKTAYFNGSTIAGTSAGAAMMSKQMITGSEYSRDTLIAGSFKKIAHHLVELKEGLGLVENAIIDQHFIVRSRYNRLLSVLAAYPAVPCIGIDEATAIIISGKRVTVTGSSQVIRFTAPSGYTAGSNTTTLVHMKNILMDILVAGDVFMLR